MTRPNALFVGTIKTEKGPLRARFEPIRKGSAVILAGAPTPKRNGSRAKPLFDPGAVFIKNAELKRRTKGGTEWLAYPGGLYQAWRTGGQIERHAGGLLNGEFDILLRDRDIAREYIQTILGPECLDPSVRQACIRVFNEAASHLGTARDPRKAMAHAHFSRATDLTDATGRRNPGAAAMRVGAGIGLLNKREDELEFIVRHVGMRTYHLYRAIQKSMDVYRGIRWHLNPNKSGKNAYKFRLIAFVERGDKPRACSVLRDFEVGLKTIHAEPFRGNAFRARRDVELALKALERFGTSDEDAAKRELETVFRRLRQGIAWPFARDFLEMNIIAPLSWALKDAEREGKASPDAPPSGNGISRKDAPEAFDAITERIRDFRGRVEKIADDLLAHPVKADVLARTNEALEYVRQDDWGSVKEELKYASEIM